MINKIQTKIYFLSLSIFIVLVDQFTKYLISYNNKLWKATTSIVPQSDSIQFTSFASVAQQIESIGNTTQTSEQIDVLLTGNYPFTGITVDHVLVKAPKLQYSGIDINDTIKLKWNKKTIANQNQTTYTTLEPFAGGGLGALSSTFFSGTHQIQMKVDLILNINAFTNKPQAGQKIQTQTPEIEDVSRDSGSNRDRQSI